MTHSKKLFAFLLTIVMLVCILPMQVFAAKDNGWEKDGDHWYYYENGVAVKNDWRKSDGKWYYFKYNGWMASYESVFSRNDKGGYTAYVVDKSGAMVTKAGWCRTVDSYSNTYWYYLKKGGLAIQGWKKLSGKWYYFGKGNDGCSPGRMLSTQGRVLNGTMYVFNNSGELVTSTGWYKITEIFDNVPHYKWYYLKKGGVAVTGWKKLGGKWYFLSKNYGYMFTGKAMIDGKIYEFDMNGVCLNPYAYD